MLYGSWTVGRVTSQKVRRFVPSLRFFFIFKERSARGHQFPLKYCMTIIRIVFFFFSVMNAGNVMANPKTLVMTCL